MIFVDRSKVSQPSWFGSQQWQIALHQLANHLGTGGSFTKRAQSRSVDILNPWPDTVVSAIWDLFQSRCAMCESAVPGLSPAEISRFRPLEIEESKNRYAYSYAALLWDNLIVLCGECNRARGDRFPCKRPIINGQNLLHQTLQANHSPADTYRLLTAKLAEARDTERPVQIDPTRDEPAYFLSFSDDGLVKADVRNKDPYLRGNRTIDTFKLNRPDLVQKRRGAVAFTAGGLQGIRKPNRSESAQQVASIIGNLTPQLSSGVTYLVGGEFEAAKASHLVRWLRRWVTAPFDQVLENLRWRASELNYARRVILPIWDPSPKTIPLHGMAQQTRPDVPTPDDPDISSPAAVRHFARMRLLKVRLKNFRQFRLATLSLPMEAPGDFQGPDRKLRDLLREANLNGAKITTEPESYSSWKMLLGENGVGKTSVLQAVALALIADESGLGAVKDLCDLPKNLFDGAKAGSIEVWLEERPKPICLKFTTKGVSLSGVSHETPNQPQSTAAPRPVLFLRGYGATRLLPEGTDPFNNTNASQEVRNLFNPRHSLASPEEWLSSLSEDAQQLAFIALKDLLDISSGDLELRNVGGAITFGLSRYKRFTPLAHFSSGYRTIVALGCDIMAGFGQLVGDMRKHMGIILLDEIGTDLHPRWRLRIVRSLRRTFPLLQFVASTHEPLCLRGLGEGEVSLLNLSPKGITQLCDKEVPSPAIYRVEQLLTGEFFGLETTFDPDEEEAFAVYHTLLEMEASQGPKMPAERVKLLEHLRVTLKERLALGDTAAERQVLEVLEEARVKKGRLNARKPMEGSKRAKAAAQRLLNKLRATA